MNSPFKNPISAPVKAGGLSGRGPLGEVTYDFVTDGLAAHWDPNNGTSWTGSGTLNDLIATANLTFGNGAAVAGTAPKYVNLDGDNDSLYNINQSILQVGTGIITVCAWIYPTRGSGFFDPIITKRTSAGTAGWEIVNGAGSLRATIRGGTTRDIYGQTLSLNAWQLVGFSYNETTGAGRIFKNESIGSPTPGTGATIDSTSAQLQVGDRMGDVNNDYAGRIGKMFVYNRFLSTVEIVTNYRATKATYGL